MGGVIIDIDYHLTVQEFQKLGSAHFETIFTQVKQMGFVDEFEKGRISPAEFRNQIRIACKSTFTNQEIDKAWNALILNLNPIRVETVKQLSKHYSLYLLSNNNAIHYQQLISKIEETISFDRFSQLFVKNYYSHLLGMRKPDQEIFEFVLSENKLNASETLFVDDSVQHLETAKLLGIKTLLVDTSNTLEHHFKFS